MTLTEPTFHHSPSLPVSMPLTDGPEVSSTDILSPAIEFEAYDPVKIQQQFQGQIFRVMQRWVTILWPFLLLLGRRSWDKRTPSTHGRHKRRAIQLRETLTVLGPALSKLVKPYPHGQIFSQGHT